MLSGLYRSPVLSRTPQKRHKQESIQGIRALINVDRRR